MGIISGIIGGLSSVATSLIDRKTQIASQEAQNKANMELSKYQYAQQKDMFDKANLYNSPAEQMNRFRSAGLNPNLIYGQGSAGNSPNVLPQYHSPDISAKRFSPVNPIAVFQAVINAQSQIQGLKNLKTQGEVLEADRDMKVTQAGNMAEYWSKKLHSMYYSNRDIMNRLGVQYNDWFGNQSYQDSVKEGSAYQRAMTEIAKNRTMLGVYNSQIALNEKRKQLYGLDIANYLPNYLKTQSGLWGNIAKTIFGANQNYKVGVMSKDQFEKSLNRPNHYQGW